MNLWCLDDIGGWGRDLHAEATRRGWTARLFRCAADVDVFDGYAFMRVNQTPPRIRIEKATAEGLHVTPLVLIPDITQLRLYDDKLAQSIAFSNWMPPTLVFRSLDNAQRLASFAVDSLGLPFVSKSSEGSASHNVRLIRTGEEAVRELAAAFGPHGIQARYSVQHGYVIWQKFLPGNDYDYRVVAVGRQRLILRRHNRDDVPFASGSGRCQPVTTLDAETSDVLEAANEFFAGAQTKWCGIDLVRDLDTRAWKVLETTLGWKQPAYAGCAFIGTSFMGADIWRVLCDEIDAGVFACKKS
jgi:hypothetical protein